MIHSRRPAGPRVEGFPGTHRKNVSVSCAARTAPAHDARARLATWPLQGGTQHDTGLEHDLATHTETVPGSGRQSASLEEGRIFVGNE